VIPENFKNIDWKKMDGLLPAVVQDADTLQVLMVGYVNEAALAATFESKKVTFFSRSKNRLWVKGESSENYLHLVSAEADCDNDSLLIFARPAGPTCHKETTSCFGETTAPGIGFLGKLAGVVAQRFAESKSAAEKVSYTSSLFREGEARMAQKVGEEGVETVIAAMKNDREELRGEAADLVFHLMVLLQAKGLGLPEVVEKLRERHAKKTAKA
jgi:phosphoribosyl-ATP pyrophosphohydrolase/phosphoribosyl-AMP cyclohydrolase